MEKKERNAAYISILKEELIPAMGCTEPIALAYAAAYAREVLGVEPDKVTVEASGSIIKNVKSVIVPNTDFMHGIDAAAAAGIVAGDAAKKLEVLAAVTPEQTKAIKSFMERVAITVKHIEKGCMFDIIVTLEKGASYSKVRIANQHTNIVLVEKDGQKLVDKGVVEVKGGLTDRSSLNLADIWDFITTVDVEEIKGLLKTQVEYNYAIAQEGLRGDYGGNIGKVLLATYGDKDVAVRAKAMAAAGSDARMNGCEEPVVINSGSGNQGITVAVPIKVYADELKVSEEKLYRALALGNLVGIHEKTGIGVLSAYCGAVSAGAGAGAGIAYLCGSDYAGVCATVSNALAILSGTICDGASASCAAKIAASVEAGILGYKMHLADKKFNAGDGIVGKDVEETIANVGRLAKEGMEKTNNVIIQIMIQ